jgi:flagellar biosynthesis/type III secretory pathway protein FliH
MALAERRLVQAWLQFFRQVLQEAAREHEQLAQEIAEALLA